MSGRSGYGRSKIVGKIIHRPANMMIAGLAPRIGKSGASIRLYYQRIDECFCVCDPCIIKEQVVPLPPTVTPLPPSTPPPLPTGPPTLPPVNPTPPFLPPSGPGFPFSSSQLPGRNSFLEPTNAGVAGAENMLPFGTIGGCPTESWGSILTGGGNDYELKSGGHWVMAQFNREVTVLGGDSLNTNVSVGNYPVSIDISWNNYGPYIHGESGKPAVEAPFLNVKYRKIAENSPVFQVGFGGNTAFTGGATNPGSYIADAVYIAQNVPFAFRGEAPDGIGDTPTQPYGMAPYQWLLLDISTALRKIAEWNSFPTNWGVGGQWAPTQFGRMAAYDFSKYNSLPLIQYNPTLSIPGPNQYDARNGLLFAEACNIGIGVLGPLAPFNTPNTATLIG